MKAQRKQLIRQIIDEENEELEAEIVTLSENLLGVEAQLEENRDSINQLAGKLGELRSASDSFQTNITRTIASIMNKLGGDRPTKEDIKQLRNLLAGFSSRVYKLEIRQNKLEKKPKTIKKELPKLPKLPKWIQWLKR